MNDRFGGERNRYGAPGRQWNNDERAGSRGGRDDERSGWGRGRDEDESSWRSEGREPQFSSDYDETYGSEWERDRGEGQRAGFRPGRQGGLGQSERYGQGGGYYGQGGSYGGQGGSYGQGGGYGRSQGSGWYSRGNAGQYGGAGRGGYSGGYGGGGFGGSGGTDYGRGSYGYGRGYGGGASGSYGDFAGSRDQRLERERGGFAGRGPKGYTRTDDRIREDVCDRLSMDDDVDASEIEVRVEGGEVTLEGTVQTRSMKHQAEDIAEEVQGVHDVHNRLRVIKSILNELKDKITGEDEGHYAHGGTKTTGATRSVGSSTGTNGTL